MYYTLPELTKHKNKCLVYTMSIKCGQAVSISEGSPDFLFG